MPERLVDAIDELAQPNRPQQEEPQIQADPALRRPRLLRNAHAAVVAVIVAGTAAAAGWATFWALGMPAVSDRLGPMSEHLAIRLAAAVLVGVVAGGLVAWVFRPVQTLRGAVRSWLIASRRRTARIPLFASVAAAVLIGLVLSALLTRAIGGVFVMETTPATTVDVVKAALPAIAGIVVAVALVLVYRRQKDSDVPRPGHRIRRRRLQTRERLVRQRQVRIRHHLHRGEVPGPAHLVRRCHVQRRPTSTPSRCGKDPACRVNRS